MKEREVYASIRAIPPVIIRLDGRNFKRVLHEYTRPFDKRFAVAMADSSELFLRESGLSPVLAYTFSDEISIFFQNIPFDGRIEKLDSVVSSFFSSALTIFLDLNEPISFDARVIPLCAHDLDKYLIWRQVEAWRNHVNSYGYYTLRKEGLNERDATEKMHGMKASEIHEMVFACGINLNETPAWHRRGVLIVKEIYEKKGYNPKEGKEMTAPRTRVIQIWDLPAFSSKEGGELIEELIQSL